MKQSKTMKHSKIVTTIIATVLGVFLVGGLTIQAAPGDMIRKSAFSQEGLQTQRLMIQDAGTYVLTGSMHGTIYVDPGIGDVRLILDNARIEGGQEPAIMAVSGNSLHIEPKAGTVNMLSQNGKEAPIYSSVNTTFDGPGQLQIQGQGQYGVRMENAHLTVNAGNYFVQANNTGLGMTGNQPGNIAFNGGNVFVNAQDPVQHGANVSYNGGQVHQATAADMVPSGQNQGQIPSGQGQTPSDMGQGQIPSDMETQSSTDTAGQIVEGITTNSAADLEADYENATTIVLSDDGITSYKVTESGTYILSGTSSEGSITVKKETTGVVLVLDNLNLTSSSGAALAINKEAEVKVIVSGDVVLTDAENPEDEYSEDADVADAYDGAVIKAKANTSVYITGDGSLTLNGDAKNGIKMGDESSLVIDGDLDITINAANDGINSNYDVAVLDGNITINAEDDGIHADHILTIGNDDGTGPDLTITNSTEGIEATVVNVKGGEIDITASDDAINAANGDGIYEGELEYSYNQTGGNVTATAGTDGIDSNGNVNLIDGSATIQSANNGGDAGIDYDGELYISEDYDLNNNSGVAGPDNMGGMPGGWNGQPEDQTGGFGQGQAGGFGQGQSAGQPGFGQEMPRMK